MSYAYRYFIGRYRSSSYLVIGQDITNYTWNYVACCCSCRKGISRYCWRCCSRTTIAHSYYRCSAYTACWRSSSTNIVTNSIHSIRRCRWYRYYSCRWIQHWYYRTCWGRCYRNLYRWSSRYSCRLTAAVHCSTVQYIPCSGCCTAMGNVHRWNIWQQLWYSYRYSTCSAVSTTAHFVTNSVYSCWRISTHRYTTCRWM